MVDAVVICRSKELKDVFDQQLADRDDKIDQLTTQLKAITDALAASTGNRPATHNIELPLASASAPAVPVASLQPSSLDPLDASVPIVPKDAALLPIPDTIVLDDDDDDDDDKDLSASSNSIVFSVDHRAGATIAARVPTPSLVVTMNNHSVLPSDDDLQDDDVSMTREDASSSIADRSASCAMIDKRTLTVSPSFPVPSPARPLRGVLNSKISMYASSQWNNAQSSQ